MQPGVEHGKQIFREGGFKLEQLLQAIVLLAKVHLVQLAKYNPQFDVLGAIHLLFERTQSPTHDEQTKVWLITEHSSQLAILEQLTGQTT